MAKRDVRRVRREPYRRPDRDGYWCSVRDTWNNRVHRFATGCVTKRSAQQYMEEWIADREAREDRVAESPAPTFDEAFTAWLAAKTVRPITLAHYQNDFESVYSPVFGKMPLDQIRRKDIQQFDKKLAEKKSSARCRRKHVGQLRSFFSECVFDEEPLTQANEMRMRTLLYMAGERDEIGLPFPVKPVVE